MAGRDTIEDDDDGPTLRFEMRLDTQTHAYLLAIKKKGFYGRTVSRVVRSFIDAGIREAIDKKYITATDSDD